MIFYLSGTGNSKWAAQKIAQLTQETLYAISEFTTGDCNFALKADERIGFVFPVHGWRPPKIMRTFMQKLQLHAENLEQHFCYLLCTAGNDIGMTMVYAQKDLEKAGLHVHAMFSLLMPNTYVGLPFMDVDHEGMSQQKKQEATQDLQHYAQAIFDCKHGEGTFAFKQVAPYKQLRLRRLFYEVPYHGQTISCQYTTLCEMWYL